MMAEEAPAAAGATDEHRARLPFIARHFPKFTQRQWRVFGISTTAGFFDNYDGALLSLALKQIQRGLGIAEGSLGAMLSLIRLGYLGSLFISPLADVFGRRRLLLYTVVGYTVFTALSALAQSERSFIAAQMLARAFSGAEATVSIVILVEEVEAAVRGWALGMQGALSISGYGLAAIVFSMITIMPYGWRGLYSLALIPLVLIIPLRRMLPESKRFEGEEQSGTRPDNVLQPLVGMFRVYPQRLLTVLAVSFFNSAGGGPAGFFIPKYLQEAHNWSPGQVSSLYVFGGALGIVGNIVAGRSSDRFGRRVMGSLFMLSAALIILWLYATRSNSVVMLWIVWLFCDQAAGTLMNAYSAELFPTSFRSSAASALLVSRLLGGAMGLFLEGLLYGVLGTHWGAVRYLVAFPIAASVAMFIFFPETAGRELEAIAPAA
jgi:MFS family permease